MDPLLKLGDLLTQNDGEGWYLVIAARMGAFTLCRVPPGMQPVDFGRRFVHDPDSVDPAGYRILPSVATSLPS